LPRTKSAEKALRVSQRRRDDNKPVKSQTKTYVKKAEQLISSNELESAREAVKQAIAAVDRAAQKGVIHPNNAARRKSRLMKKLNAAQPADRKSVV
jgi:small subunit ribosomal protein S20